MVQSSALNCCDNNFISCNKIDPSLVHHSSWKTCSYLQFLYFSNGIISLFSRTTFNFVYCWIIMGKYFNNTKTHGKCHSSVPIILADWFEESKFKENKIVPLGHAFNLYILIFYLYLDLNKWGRYCQDIGMVQTWDAY